MKPSNESGSTSLRMPGPDSQKATSLATCLLSFDRSAFSSRYPLSHLLTNLFRMIHLAYGLIDIETFKLLETIMKY